MSETVVWETSTHECLIRHCADISVPGREGGIATLTHLGDALCCFVRDRATRKVVAAKTLGPTSRVIERALTLTEEWRQQFTETDRRVDH